MCTPSACTGRGGGRSEWNVDAISESGAAAGIVQRFDGVDGLRQSFFMQLGRECVSEGGDERMVLLRNLISLSRRNLA